MNPAEQKEHVPGVDPMRDIEEFYKQHDALYERPEPVSLTESVKRPERNYDFYEPIVITRPERVTIYPKARIDSFVKIEGGEGVIIGRYVHIASFVHIGIGGGTTVIKDFAAVASGAKIISGSNQADALSMSACAPQEIQRVERKMTVIEQYAVVLTNAVVMPGVRLGEGAVLAAGAVATRDIPAWEIWAGVPAKFLRKREVAK
jgi:acetyltransferase-like isoleucine patch superfamily enzyme